jgi:hypothetical protein
LRAEIVYKLPDIESITAVIIQRSFRADGEGIARLVRFPPPPTSCSADLWRAAGPDYGVTRSDHLLILTAQASRSSMS